MRQQGSEQEQFRAVLGAIRDMAVNKPGWELLSTRVRANLSTGQVANFDNALRIFPVNNAVDDYNCRHLSFLPGPVLSIEATGFGTGWNGVSSRDAGNLELRFPLALKSRCMLTENIWVETGLVNGALGTVEDLAWQIYS
ncbi:hypothetical protein F4804DRAFT_339597 [Jackrogersella minutella]|nr:hypothetical protein F4804DRAFT_339597 [Jackrogersella minutella]